MTTTRTQVTVDRMTAAPIKHAEAMQLTATEFDRFSALLRRLGPDDWSKQTDCDRWDVRGVALHILGSAAANASPREAVHQFRVGKPLTEEVGGDFWVDGVNELQIRERAHITNEQIADELDQIAPKAVRSRRRLPWVIRKLPLLNLPAPIGRVGVDYLMDMGFTRDVWMHRVDIARATGAEMELTAEHDGRMIGDIVAEWARLHGEAVDITLTGPAGCRLVQGEGGEQVTVDAVEFCRIVSGRVAATGVLAHPLPL